jgi:hypothetical protein
VAEDAVPPRVVLGSQFPTLDDYDRTAHRYRADFVHADAYIVFFDAFPGADVVGTIDDPEPDQGGPDNQKPPVEIKKLRLPVGTTGFDFALRSEDGSFRTSRSTDLRPDLRDLRGIINEALPDQEWHWTVRVPREGPLIATVRFRDVSGGGPVFEHRIVIREYYIVGLGDSFASGEGNPDRKGQADQIEGFRCDNATAEMLIGGLAEKVGQDTSFSLNRGPVWFEPAAHRSLLAGHALGVKGAEDLAGGRVVTLTSFASSGATIDAGLLGRQHEWQPAGGQIEEARLAADGKHIDAVVMSIGGNDVGFSSGLEDLAKDWRSGKLTEMRRKTRERIAALEGRFTELADRIDAELRPDHVFVTEYPAGFFDQPGPHPGTGRRAAGCGVFSSTEFFAVSGVDADTIFGLAHELNAKIQSIVDRHENWTYIGGIVDGFTGHGYCAPDPFFVAASTSCRQQGDFFGTMHPDQQGQAVYGRAVSQALRSHFDQHPAEPRMWLEPILHTMLT